jgi:hypothetical protein
VLCRARFSVRKSSVAWCNRDSSASWMVWRRRENTTMPPAAIKAPTTPMMTTLSHVVCQECQRCICAPSSPVTSSTVHPTSAISPMLSHHTAESGESTAHAKKSTLVSFQAPRGAHPTIVHRFPGAVEQFLAVKRPGCLCSHPATVSGTHQLCKTATMPCKMSCGDRLMHSYR